MGITRRGLLRGALAAVAVKALPRPRAHAQLTEEAGTMPEWSRVERARQWVLDSAYTVSWTMAVMLDEWGNVVQQERGNRDQ